MNQTGWPVQIFHGPTNGPQLRRLFAAQIGAKVAMAKGGAARPSLTLTDLGDDYMEDWVRHISPISPHISHISPISPLYLPYISPISPGELVEDLRLAAAAEER